MYLLRSTSVLRPGTTMNAHCTLHRREMKKRESLEKSVAFFSLRFFHFLFFFLFFFWLCAIFWFRCTHDLEHIQILYLLFHSSCFFLSSNVYIMVTYSLSECVCILYTLQERKSAYCTAEHSICWIYRTCTAASNRIWLDTIALIPFFAFSLCPFLFMHFSSLCSISHWFSLTYSSAVGENHIPCENIELWMHFFVVVFVFVCVFFYVIR